MATSDELSMFWGYDSMQCGRHLPTFRSNILPSSSGSKYKNEYGDNKFSFFLIYLFFGLSPTARLQRCKQGITPINLYQNVRLHELEYSTVCTDCREIPPPPKSRTSTVFLLGGGHLAMRHNVSIHGPRQRSCVQTL